MRFFEMQFYVMRNLLQRFLKIGTDNHPLNVSASSAIDLNQDADVQAEKDRINAMSEDEIKNYNLVLKNMTKIYDQFVAVNKLSLVVDQ